MRADQLLKLRTLQERVCDVFLDEADPKDWPGLDSKEGRGDRFWLKKNAAASLAIIGRIENLLALRDGRVAGGTTPGDEGKSDEELLAQEIKDAEKEAAALGANVVRLRGKRKAKG